LRSLADEAAQDDPSALDADALIASLEQGDAGDEAAARRALLPPAAGLPKAPDEGRFTVDHEVSRLLGGIGGGAQKVVVMRGAKSEQKSFRGGQAEPPSASSDADNPDAVVSSIEPPEEMQP